MSDPVIAKQLLEGGMAFVALVFILQIFTLFVNYLRNRDNTERSTEKDLLYVINITLTDLKGVINNNTSAVDALKNHIARQDEQLAQQNNNLDTLTQRVGSVETKLDTVVLKVDRIQAASEQHATLVTTIE
jgi:CII-binding regulator of phage lambda lysogenization HflD